MTNDEPGFERRRLRVYVAGPISTGDMLQNVHAATLWGRQMVQDGLAPYVPHLDAYMLAREEEISWNAYLEWDLEWVVQSEALFRLHGASKGGDLEVRHARAAGVPVFYERTPTETVNGYLGLLSMAARLDLKGVRK